jgi:hypothetical protein
MYEQIGATQAVLRYIDHYSTGEQETFEKSIFDALAPVYGQQEIQAALDYLLGVKHIYTTAAPNQRDTTYYTLRGVI